MKTTLKLVCEEQGRVVIEIRTGHGLSEFYFDRPLEDVLREPSAFELTVSGPGRRWRYPGVRCAGPVGGGWLTLLDRIIDLSEGSEERRLFELMVLQSEIPVVWVNEGIEISFRPPPTVMPALREVVENTRGVSRDDWEEELVELDWQESESWRPGPRPGKVRRRKAAAPDLPVPFFAPLSGALPGARRPEVDGVKLPPGQRHPKRTPSYWASTAPVTNLDLMLPWLTSQFVTTGLWPLLWRIDEDPEAYMGGHGDLDSIDSVSPADALRKRWGEPSDAGAREPFDDFPGLAPATPWTADTLQKQQINDLDPAYLLLVPCNRPADAMSMLGGLAIEVEATVISSVLRSWEERFAAVPCEVQPSGLALSVGAPPESDAQALALAAEVYALCAASNAGLTVRAIANVLLARSGDAPGIEIGPHTWRIGWLD